MTILLIALFHCVVLALVVIFIMLIISIHDDKLSQINRSCECYRQAFIAECDVSHSLKKELNRINSLDRIKTTDEIIGD
jgi:hypothetical protein